MEVRVRSWWSGVIAVALVAGFGCKGDDEGEDSDVPVEHGITDVQVEALPMPTALEITWTTPSAGRGFVEYGVGDAFDRVSTEETDGTDHAVTLVLLKSNTTYQVRAVTELDDGSRIESAPVEVAIAPPPQGMPRIVPDVLDPDAAVMDDGYALMTFLGQGSWVGIMDGDGTWVWWAEMDAADLSSARARLSRDRRSVLYNLYQTDRHDDQGWIVRLGLDGRGEVRTRTLTGHHDFVELPDGNLAWLGYDRRDVDVEGETSDPTGEIAAYGDGPYPVATDVIYEGPEGLAEGEEPGYVWGFFDDYVADPWWQCFHMENQGEFVPDYFEWTHSNSMVYVEEDDSYYVMARYLDALLKIDRATGSLIWQLGGEHATMTFTSGEPFNHGHVSDIWDGGMLMFDNRDHAEGASRIVEISWDDAAGTAQVDWEFERKDGALLDLLGDARRLPGGNRLAVWSQKGEMAEVTPDGEVVFRTSMAFGAAFTRVEYFTEDEIGYPF